MPEVLVLGTAEWQTPILTNQHHAAKELAVSARVTFVESLGLRRPSLRPQDVARIAARARRSLLSRGPAAPIGAQLRVISPVVAPWHTYLTRELNTRLLRLSVRDWLAASTAFRVLWTYTPVTYGLELDADLTIYHCVDLLGCFPGVDAKAVDTHEKRLARAGVRAIASSAVVRDHLVEQGFTDVMLWTNVADAGVFATGSLDGPREPIVVFAGNLTPKKIDFELLTQLARALSGTAKLVLAGPIAAGGGPVPEEIATLQAIGVEFPGVLAPEQLATLYQRSSVGLIPYAINAYTTGVSPLKTFEYLGSGMPVVSTPVPSVEEVPGDVFVRGDPSEFIEAVIQLLRTGAPDDRARRRRLALDHTWQTRGQQMRDLIAGHGRSVG